MRHDGPDAGSDENVAAAGKSSASAGSGSNAPHPTAVDPPTACAHVCANCAPDASVAECDNFCTTVLDEATSAGCAAPLTSLLRCQDSANEGCSTDACPAENNALTACILEYCDKHANASVCVSSL